MTRIRACGAFLLALLLGAAGSAAAEGPKDRDARWIPSATGTFRILNYHAEGRIDSNIGFSADGQETESAPHFQIGFDLLSPTLDRVPTAPRLVGFAGVQLGPTRKLELADDGELLPDQPQRTIDTLIARPPPNGIYPAPETLPGQGSRLSGKYQSLGWYLGMGVAFELPTDPGLRVRPYVNYVGEQAKIKGTALRVTGQPPGTPYVVERASQSVEEVFHYLGPGLELELLVDTGDSWGLSFFATVDFLWNVGDDRITFSDPAARAVFHYEADDFQPRGGAGVRLSWLGGL